MTNILFLPRHNIDPNGRGGHHRDYQILTNLREIFGNTEVGSLFLESTKPKRSTKIKNYWEESTKRLNLLLFALRNKISPQILRNELIRIGPYFVNPFGELYLDDYFEYIKKNGKPKVCVVDFPMCLPIIKFNQLNNIPTIYCPHNIDSFDIHSHLLVSDNSRMSLSLSWLVELETLASTSERLMISKVETSIINGLGLSSYYYPYLPVGVIRERFMDIRFRRNKNKINNKLFLMLGSITHRTTEEGFRWFLNNSFKNGLPKGINIIVAGRGGEKFASEYINIPGIEFRGILDQLELSNYLNKVAGVLIPQFSGFGAVTRLAEMSCAGIPVIVSEHPINALHKPPGVIQLSGSWKNWVETIMNFQEISENNSFLEFEDWEKNQPNPLFEVINQYL